MAGRGALRAATVAFDLQPPALPEDTYSMLRIFARDVRTRVGPAQIPTLLKSAFCVEIEVPAIRSRRPNAAA